jgi:hypothetical protein
MRWAISDEDGDWSDRRQYRQADEPQCAHDPHLPRNIRYIAIVLNGLILYDTRDDVPCGMDKWGETRAPFRDSPPQIRTQRTVVSIRADWSTVFGAKYPENALCPVPDRHVAGRVLVAHVGGFGDDALVVEEDLHVIDPGERQRIAIVEVFGIVPALRR